MIARCSVDYEGRLTAHLPLATRLLMVKADGCVAVHADGGAYKPQMWMTAPNTLREEPGRWVIRNPNGEQLTITVDEVLSDVSHDIGVDPGLAKDGVEAHLQELLAADPTRILDGLVLVRREHPTDIGPVDLLCRDADGRAVVIEIERRGEVDRASRERAATSRWVAIEVKRKAGIDAVEQLSRYLERINRDPLTRPCRGMLVATSVAPQAVVLAESRGIACVTVDYDELRGLREPSLTLF